MIMKLGMEQYVFKIYKVYINDDLELNLTHFKDLNSTVAERGSVFGLMSPDGAIWFRYQRAVLMR